MPNVEDYPPEAFRILRGLGALPRRTPGEDSTRDAIEAWAAEFLADPGEPTPADLALVAEAIALVRSAPEVPPEPDDELPGDWAVIALADRLPRPKLALGDRAHLGAGPRRNG